VKRAEECASVGFSIVAQWMRRNSINTIPRGHEYQESGCRIFTEGERRIVTIASSPYKNKLDHSSFGRLSNNGLKIYRIRESYQTHSIVELPNAHLLQAIASLSLDVRQRLANMNGVLSVDMKGRRYVLRMESNALVEILLSMKEIVLEGHDVKFEQLDE
jgi:hypothetical protein